MEEGSHLVIPKKNVAFVGKSKSQLSVGQNWVVKNAFPAVDRFLNCAK